jgi:predicted dehydrogenase
MQSFVRKIAELELVAVCDVNAVKAKKNARDFGVPECYSDCREMLQKTSAEVVAVIGTPQMHSGIGMDVLNAGKHLFVEKPLGVDLADCRRLLAAAQQSGKIVMNGYMWRYANPLARMRAIAQSPEFGRPLSVHIRFLTPQPRFCIWGLTDMLATCVITDGGHPIDIAMFLMGPAEAVRAYLAEGDGGVTSIVATLDFTDGGTGTLHTGTCTSGVDLDFMLTSSKGYTVKLQDNMNRMFYVKRDKVDYQNVPIVEGWYPAPLTVSDADHTGWTTELKTLAKCIRENKQPENDMQQGYEVMKVMRAVKVSFTEKREVKIADI